MLKISTGTSGNAGDVIVEAGTSELGDQNFNGAAIQINVSVILLFMIYSP